jgi:O-antigen/teichoic acid export membrane protein
MVVAGALLTAGGLVVTPLLAGEDSELRSAYALMFVGILLNSVFASNVYALQAVSISRWNLVRVSQPFLYAALITALALTGHLSLVGVACCLVLSLLLQFIVLAFVKGPAPAVQADDEVEIGVRRLLAYGGAYAGAAIPTAFAAQYDKLLLSRTVSASDLGQYAVGSTVANLVSPFSTAIASVMFPRASKLGLADAERGRIEAATLIRTALVSSIISAGICLVAPVLVPLLFGRSFAAAVPLVWALAVVMVVRSLSQVTGAFVRARNRPGHAAFSQIAGLVCGLLVMGPAIGLWGVFGAPVALGIGEAVTLTAIVVALVKLRRRGANEGRKHD